MLSCLPRCIVLRIRILRIWNSSKGAIRSLSRYSARTPGIPFLTAVFLFWVTTSSDGEYHVVIIDAFVNFVPFLLICGSIRSTFAFSVLLIISSAGLTVFSGRTSMIWPWWLYSTRVLFSVSLLRWITSLLYAGLQRESVKKPVDVLHMGC